MPSGYPAGRVLRPKEVAMVIDRETQRRRLTRDLAEPITSVDRSALPAENSRPAAGRRQDVPDLVGRYTERS
jgi:hypothetical protein